MSVVSQNVAIVPTPSGVLDGHFPDGNDGSAAVPLVWAPITGGFTGKQVGTPFIINLFTAYLTQPGGATASLSSGTLSGGWTLDAAGNLAYDGIGQGTGTIRVRATVVGQPTSDSGPFTFESLATISSADVLAPTSVTGVTFVSETGTTITMTGDVPSDVPTTTIPASGLKEIRWFIQGLIDGVSSFGAGLQLRLTPANVATGSIRKTFLGNYTAISAGQKSKASNGLPNPSTISDDGPVSKYTSGVVMRWQWSGLEGDTKGNYTLNNLRSTLRQCGQLKTALFAMIETRSFGGDTINFTADVTGALNGTIKNTDSLPDGNYAFVFYVATQNGATHITQTIGTVTGGVHAAWTPAVPGLPPGMSYTIAIANNYNANPLPAYLQQYSEGFVSGIKGGGWQSWRWNGTVSDRFQALCAFIGNSDAQDPAYPGTFDQHPYFGGLSTQETSNGNPRDPAYTSLSYATALKKEMTSIGVGCPSCRQLWFYNFGISQSQALDCAAWGWQYGMILCGPDLVMNSNTGQAGHGISNTCYPVYTAYANGTAGPAQGGPGLTACSIQPAEWGGSTPGDNRTIPELYNFGIGIIPNASGDKPLKLPIIIPDWHTLSSTSWNGAQFNKDATTPPTPHTSAIYAMSQHPAPFAGTFNPGTGSSMLPGSVTQNGVDYTVLSYGLGIGTADDQWYAANGQMNGDGTLIFKFAGLTSAVDTAQASMGASIRDSAGPSARAVYLVATATQLLARYRLAAGATVNTTSTTANQGFGVNKWGMVKRAANLWSFFYSTDQLTWHPIGTVTVAMASTVFIQLFGANFAGTGPVAATFEQVNMQQLAKQNYIFGGLGSGSFNIYAVARDRANNDSLPSPTVTVVIP